MGRASRQAGRRAGRPAGWLSLSLQKGAGHDATESGNAQGSRVEVPRHGRAWLSINALMSWALARGVTNPEHHTH